VKVVSREIPADRKLPSWRLDQSGNVAIVFALMAVVLMLAVGVAVDIGRWLHARDQTVGAVDAAVLAGARWLQTNSTDRRCRRGSAKFLYAKRHQSSSGGQ
jgi:Flp pilus assembly protein TadG